jgi:hypothetical protein
MSSDSGIECDQDVKMEDTKTHKRTDIASERACKVDNKSTPASSPSPFHMSVRLPDWDNGEIIGPNNPMSGIETSASNATEISPTGHPKCRVSSSSSTDHSLEGICLEYGSKCWEDYDDENDKEFEEIPFCDLLEIEAKNRIDEDESADITDTNSILINVSQYITVQEGNVTDVVPIVPNGDKCHRQGPRNLLRRTKRTTKISSTVHTSITHQSSSISEITGFYNLTSSEQQRLMWEELDRYEDGLREAGFTLVDAILSNSELALDRNRVFSQYRAKFPSPLRRCWIVPNITTPSKILSTQFSR